MIQKLKSKKGFTLAELLIVIAIIGVLVAIAIPVFSSQLDKAKEAVDDANLRSATSMAMIVHMTENPNGGVAGTYYAYVKDAGASGADNMKVASAQPSGYSPMAPQASANTGNIKIDISKDNEVISAAWAGTAPTT